MTGRTTPAASRGRQGRDEHYSATDAARLPATDPFGAGLQLEPMSADSWRLCDGSAPDDDAASVIAYIERDTTGYDVVWLQGRLGQAHFASLEETLAAAEPRCARRSAGPTRPVAIPHFAPPPA